VLGGITTPDFKLDYRAIAIKAAWYWHKNRHEDKWNKTEDPDMSAMPILFLTKVPKTCDGKKDSLLNKCHWGKWLSVCKRWKLDPCLSPCTSINS
jgi:hypothetical protein